MACLPNELRNKWSFPHDTIATFGETTKIAKYHTNFVLPDLKLQNQYCHREKYSFLGKKRKISSDTLILKWLVAPMNFAINNLPLMTQFATFGETTICLLLLSLSSDLCSLTIFSLYIFQFAHTTYRKKNNLENPRAWVSMDLK